jgi:hypothetical protein
LGPDAAERLSAGVYGALVAATTLIGASDKSFGQLIWIVVATNLVYYATHVFAYTIGSSPADPSQAESLGAVIRHHLVVSAPIASAAFIPLIVVIVLELCGVDQTPAVFFGVVAGALGLATTATSSVYLRGVRGVRLLLVAIAALIVAGLLVAAKLALH